MVGRGEVWLVTLDPSMGSKIRKSRPCLIVSPPEMHDYLRTVIVAPNHRSALPAFCATAYELNDLRKMSSPTPHQW
jgi:mRNA interferase MazF